MPAPIFMQPCSGVIRQDEHSWMLRMQALPQAEVTVTIGNERETAQTFPMQEDDTSGIYTYVLQNDADCLRGSQKLVFRVNGQETINPFAPLWFHANALSNYIDLPDPEMDELITAVKEIPHGRIIQEYYYSSVYDSFIKSMVYTPPLYDPEVEYPVLFLFHEVSENWIAWTDAGKMNYLLDNLIAMDRCVPFIVVENDCTVFLDYHDREDWFEGYPQLEQFLLTDCLPHMEKAYRIEKRKEARAIAGYGLGAVQACYIGARNTDVFSAMGAFTAFWPSSGFHAKGKEDPFYTAFQKIGENPGSLRVFFRSEGDLDRHFEGIYEENALLRALNVDRIPVYVEKVYHQSHNWNSYRRSLRDFAPLLFR